MLESNLNDVDNDARTLLSNAQALFQSAVALTGEKSEEMRYRAMRLLDVALDKAQQAQASGTAAGRQMAASTDGYVKQYPWHSIAAAAGTGLLLGVVLGRR